MSNPEQDTARAEVEPGAEQDLMSMDMDELKALIDGGAEGVTEEAPVEEPEADEEVQEAAVEEEPSEESAEAAEVTEEQEEPPTLDSEDILLRLEETEKRMKHFESLASRQANEKGQWMTKAQELEQRLERIARQQRDPDLEDEEPYREPRQSVAKSGTNDASDAFVTQIAIEREAAAFRQRHPDAFTEDGNISEDVAAALTAISKEATAILESRNPVEASQRTRAMLEEAYSQADIQRTANKRKERERRTADQAKGLKDKKRAAAISASSGTTAAPKRKPIDPMTMPLEELKKMIDGANRL